MLPQITCGSQTKSIMLVRKQFNCLNLYSTVGGLVERRGGCVRRPLGGQEATRWLEVKAFHHH